MNKEQALLRNIQGQQKTIEWADVYFAAEAAHEPFEEVDIITARTKLVELAYDAASHAIHNEGLPLSVQLVVRIARTLIDTRKVFVHESVTVDRGKITCCVNVDNVNDDTTLWTALDMIASTLEQLNGQSGTILFGDPVDLTIEDIAELVISHPSP